jgi:hypothetical protein
MTGVEVPVITPMGATPVTFVTVPGDDRTEIVTLPVDPLITTPDPALTLVTPRLLTVTVPTPDAGETKIPVPPITWLTAPPPPPPPEDRMVPVA